MVDATGPKHSPVSHGLYAGEIVCCRLKVGSSRYRSQFCSEFQRWNRQLIARLPLVTRIGRRPLFAIRLYVTALALTFLLSVVVTRDIGVLEATVMVCSVLYIILDIRTELQELRLLEARVDSLSR